MKEDIIKWAQEVGFVAYGEDAGEYRIPTPAFHCRLERFAALARADERERFYGQDKPAECAKGCPPKQICDYCQVVAPVRAMILAEREACAKLIESRKTGANELMDAVRDMEARAIRARGQS
jgi:hypothetical protein